VVVATATTRRIIKVAPAAMKKIRGETMVEAAFPCKEDVDVYVDVVEIHLDSATTLSAKYARKNATPHTPASGAMRTTTTTMNMTRKKSTPPMVWIPIGILTPG
jgi:hypothetical protein